MKTQRKKRYAYYLRLKTQNDFLWFEISGNTEIGFKQLDLNSTHCVGTQLVEMWIEVFSSTYKKEQSGALIFTNLNVFFYKQYIVKYFILKHTICSIYI